jgi:hypothetical protein
MRHIETRQRACTSKIRVHREQILAEMWRRLDVGEDVVEELVRVLPWLVVWADGLVGVARGFDFGLTVVEDDDFVDGEDGAGASDGAGEGEFEVVGLGAVVD